MELISFIAFIAFIAITALLTWSERKGTTKPKDRKIDITNARPTRSITLPILMEYNGKRKSKWKVPEASPTIDYEKYILSLKWRTSQARQKTISLDNFSCRMCGAKYPLHVHHISYKNLGKETLEDLVTLCEVCHEYTHKMAGKGAREYPPLKAPSK